MSVTIQKLLEVWDNRPSFWDPNNVQHLEWTSTELLPAILRARPDLLTLLGQPRVIPPPPVIPPHQDPEMRWDDDLGWLHVGQLDAINELRGEIARARGASQPSQLPGPDVSVPSTGTPAEGQSPDTSSHNPTENLSTAGTGAYLSQIEGTDGTPASAPATDPVSPATIDAPAALKPKQRRQSAKRKAAGVPPGLPGSIGLSELV